MDVLAAVIVFLGAVMTFLASIGLFKFEDLYARMHAATKPATLGLMLILLGAALLTPGWDATIKLVLIVLLQFITAPVGAHLMGRAAFRAGVELAPETRVDDESLRWREMEQR